MRDTNRASVRFYAKNRALTGVALPLAMLASQAMAQQAGNNADSADAAPDVGVGDIVVTATRKSTVLSRTPASIVAKGQEELDSQGVRSIADVARITPGITFGQGSILVGTGQTAISIRGVSSASGIPTTGVYIDDTPVQTRVGVSPSLSNPYPQVFDLERLEVLRGPQGTLFGSGSVGGAIRFITPQPSYDKMTSYARAELAQTQHGALSYEAGAALGAPLVQDELGFRASLWFRHDGGYIDQLDPNTKALVKKDVNSADSVTARFALGARLNDTLTITPSIYYQNQQINHGSRFELAESNRSSGNLRNSLLQRLEPRKDHFFLPALKAELDLGAVTLLSDTSYFHRTTSSTGDDMALSLALTGFVLGGPIPAGFETYSPHTQSNSKQTALTQEFRLQDNNQNDRFNWIAGVFLQRSYVFDQYAGRDARLLEAINLGQAQIGDPPFATLTDTFFGAELYLGEFSLFQQNTHRDKQYAAYAQADYEILSGLKLTAGLRYTIAKYNYVGFGAGPFVTPDPAGQSNRFKTTSKTLTPKFGISYQADRNNLFYTTASKGVRGPGVSPAVGPQCTDDAEAIGFDPNATQTLKPDSIWSYEVGSKNRLFGGKVTLDASAYRIDWKNVQTLFALPTCTIQTALNLGDAKIDGLDLAVSVRPLDGLTVGASASYVKARYTTAIPGPNNTTIRRVGEPFPGVAPWTVQLNSEYVRALGTGSELYGRADFSYSSHDTTRIDPDNAFGDPTLPRPPASSQLDLRIGARFPLANGQGVDASLFVNNLTNSQPLLSLYHDIPDSTWYRSGTFRPRTIGLTVTLRN